MYPYNNVRQGGFSGYGQFNNFRNDVSNYPVAGEYQMMQNGGDDERFFWAPFVVGGLAGTALGYGIANNNQINNQNNNGNVAFVPAYPYPMYVYPQTTYFF